MFGLFGGIQLKIIIVIALIGAATTGYFYIQSLKHELQASLEAQQKLADTIDAQQKVMDENKKDIEKMQAINKKMNEDFNAANREISALEKKFRETSSGQQRNFNALAIQNPQSIEDKVNRGTKYALRCNELATGSPWETDDEKNNICPDLVKKRKPK